MIVAVMIAISGESINPLRGEPAFIRIARGRAVQMRVFLKKAAAPPIRRRSVVVLFLRGRSIPWRYSSAATSILEIILLSHVILPELSQVEPS